MCPFIQLGPLAIPTFGALAVVGLLLGMVLFRAEAIRLGYDPRKVEELILWTVLASWAGAKGVYIAQNFDAFAANPLPVVQGGYVLYGGVLGGAPVCYLLGRRSGIPGGRLLDIMQPGMVFALTIGRLGCFASGCDYGRPAGAERWWTVTFTHPATLVPPDLRGIPLYPSQPLMALGLFVTFLVVYAARRRLTPWPGALFTLTLAVEPILRFLIEFTRGDADRGFIGPLSASQTFAIVVAPCAAALLLWRTSRGRIDTRAAHG